MSLKARVDADHNTLTNVLTVVGKTRSEMHQRFNEIDQRFGKIDQRFDEIDQRFSGIGQRFDEIDQRFDKIDQRLDQQDKKFNQFQHEVREGIDRQDIDNAEIKETLQLILSRLPQ